MIIGPQISRLFKAMVIVKVSALLLFFLILSNVIKLGEKKTVAAPDGSASDAATQPDAPDDSTADASSPPPPSADAAAGGGTASNGEKPVTAAKTAKPARQGFLEGLLDLPALNVEGSQKDEIGRYLSLAERAKQQVDDRMRVLGERASQLQALEKSIDEKLRLLDEERKFFASTVQREKEIEAERLTTLVDLYANMEPKKAAPVFETMDKDLIVALFKKMKNKQVTRILESMTPQRSVVLTEYFGRIGSAKEYDLLKEMNSSLKEAFNDCKGLPKEG